MYIVGIVSKWGQCEPKLSSSPESAVSKPSSTFLNELQGRRELTRIVSDSKPEFQPQMQQLGIDQAEQRGGRLLPIGEEEVGVYGARQDHRVWEHNQAGLRVEPCIMA